MMDGMGMMMGWGVAGFVLVLLLVVLVIVVIVAGLRWIWLRDEPRRDNALDILKKRYAKGEIGKQEFERVKDDLR
jgi:putative membrane protein